MLKITSKVKVWVTGDQHFWHSNILKYEAEARKQFNDVEHMNEVLIKKWNQVVENQDKIYVLGDFCLGGVEKKQSILEQLSGNKALILGDHDHWISSRKWREIGFKEVYDYSIVWGEKFILSHRPLRINNLGSLKNVHAHVHSNNYDYENDGSHICVSVERTNFKPVNLEEVNEASGAE